MNYRIKDDLILLREFFEMTQEDLAKSIGIERKTITRTELEETTPSEEVLNKIYNYFYQKGLKINIQKEMYYQENIKENHILLTHGSKIGIDGLIDIKKSRNNNDFGQGFYCGEKYENVVAFICRYPNSSIYFFDFDPNNLKSITFSINNEWMLAIAYYRGKIDQFKDSQIIKDIVKKIEDCDYIIAPIADNRMFKIIDTFIEGEITDEQCKHSLAATNLGMQYVFISQKSINQLKMLERCFVSSKEKEHYQNEQINFLNIGNDKSKMARIQYRGKGKYIEEILS